MTISFSGLGSGMDYSSWVDALVKVKETSLTTVKNKISSTKNSQSSLNKLESSFSSFNSTLSTFTDSNIISAFDIFTRKTSSISDDKVASVSVSNAATVQNLELVVSQMATPTIATGVNSLGKAASYETKLVDLNNGVVEEGDVSIYVDNEKFVFEVTEESTVQDFVNFLSEKTGANVELSSDGKMSFDFSSAFATDVRFGSTSDKGNLLDFFGFSVQYDESNNMTGISMAKNLTEINLDGILMSDANLSSAVTAGTFKIGNVEFTIDETTTLSGLIYQINSDSETGVMASYDAVSNKLVLKAQEPGQTTINIEAGTSNFTDVVGWTTNGSQLAEGAQVLGKNSKFSINGEEFEAASNTVSEDVTGITGMTLTLNKITDEDEPVQINISNDLTEVETSIDNFVKQFNQLSSDIKNVTDSTGNLAYDSTLRRMLTDMSNVIMDIVPGLSNYVSFSSVGISTGKATTDVSNTSNNLTFDKEAFREAMAKNPNEVKKLFINEDDTNVSANGVMVKLENMVSEYLDVEKGYFAIKEDSFDEQIKTLNASLTRKQNAITDYRERLTRQFQNMDSYISKMQSYQSYLV